MRICYISHSSSHFTVPHVDYFARQGHEVHLISFLGPGLPGVVTHHPLGRDPRPALRQLAYLRAVPEVRRILRSLGACLVSAHYASSNGLVAALAGRHPLVQSVHGTDLRGTWNPLRSAALRYALARADLVNPVSRAFEGRLLSLGVPRERLLVLTHGIDSRRFVVDRSGRREGPARLICTRTPDPLYNAGAIVRALSILSRRGVRFEFTFAAGGSEEAA